MAEPAEIEALLRLMPPETASDTTVDWDLITASWGTAFPAAYRRFITLYGAGAIQDYLVIGEPEPWAEPPTGDDNDMRAGTAFARVLWAESRKDPALDGTSPRLILWGLDSSGDNLCWDASGPDPERWPVLVYDRGESIWRRYDCGMVEFLVRHLRGDFAGCPLGDVYLFGRGSAMFLTRTEYRRRLRSGVDPWTGEPDPYAGMYHYG
ncbi:hypothetical protein [Actinoplanes palleronii]|uniref:Knr4/Smi1-like domain-containing protein n=1 Tax=Actinoplanes palleronii TaxID=113570 RepID=A0ABQ4B1C9_9ACTN|nr:hypothetical protein [Actinoplanes palleronii]GIE64470.1 hypothetical protein Apa02nite_005780 [Actinoplanes palleronii]